MIETTTNAVSLIVIIGGVAVLAYQEYMHRKELKKRVSGALQIAAEKCVSLKYEDPDSAEDKAFNEGCALCAAAIGKIRLYPMD